MNKLKKIFLRSAIILAAIYVLVCTLLYFEQESFIFHPKPLSLNYKFNYTAPFEELNIETADKKKLNGLLFKADSAKGLIFYLHGNAGALDTWGDIAKTYTDLDHDIFILDYRGFGKSEGEINNEEQFFSDVQAAYNKLRSKYSEDKIVIIGYSIGTGPAAMLAAKNSPKNLILLSPYFSLIDMMHRDFSFVPDFLMKYKFETFSFVKQSKAPVTIFHGTNDQVIYYGSSLKLKQYFKPADRLVTLEGQGHARMNENEDYRAELKKLLSGF